VTAELNEKVFADPGFSPSAMARLVAVLKTYRKDAGDF
jgi:hypothetical protein